MRFEAQEQLLIQKILILNETAWENRIPRPLISEWLDNFNSATDDDARRRERYHALYILSQFVYFGSRQMRELLKALYRDLFKYPIVQEIRRAHDDTTDIAVLQQLFDAKLARTRFLGIGNPSESGCHLLYYFRQENILPKALFIHTHEIFSRSPESNERLLRNTDVERYVFIDDLCGSGDQGRSYSEEIVSDIKRLNPKAQVSYLVLFATSDGKKELRKQLFDYVEAVVELDETFRLFGEHSRYFAAAPEGIDKSIAEQLCVDYGEQLWQDFPLGYRDGQLLLGFHHNTPDNTIPIMWWDYDTPRAWVPIFPRYPKVLAVDD